MFLFGGVIFFWNGNIFLVVPLISVSLCGSQVTTVNCITWSSVFHTPLLSNYFWCLDILYASMYECVHVWLSESHVDWLSSFWDSRKLIFQIQIWPDLDQVYFILLCNVLSLWTALICCKNHANPFSGSWDISKTNFGILIQIPSWSRINDRIS